MVLGLTPAKEVRNVCSVPRIDLEGGITINKSPEYKAKSLVMGYLLSFFREGGHSNKQTPALTMEDESFSEGCVTTSMQSCAYIFSSKEFDTFNSGV